MGGHSEGTPRQGYRFPTGLPAELHDGGQTIPCGARNISRSGVLLVGPLPTPSATVVELTVRSATGTLAVRLSGRVVRVDPDAEEGGTLIALEFVDMDDARRAALESFIARILESQTVGPLSSLKPGAPPPEVRKVLGAIPLSLRIALATRVVPVKDREFLRLDTNPAVLEALVHNPNVTVVEARAIAESPYLMPGTIDALANDLRFKGDEELRMTLAVHPRVSLATAEKITADFKVRQLKKLLAKPGLNQILREKLFRRTTAG